MDWTEAGIYTDSRPEKAKQSCSRVVSPDGRTTDFSSLVSENELLEILTTPEGTS